MAAAVVSSPIGAADLTAPLQPPSSLRFVFNAADKSQYDNSAARRCLSGATGHRRGSAHRELENFASEKYPFAFFNTSDDHNQDQEDSVHPLFAALALGATQDVIYGLYEACPSALGETTRSGLTPLHLACQYGADGKVIEFLLRHCPSHAARKSKTSWSTPLHLAAANGGSAEVIRSLVVKSNNALAVQDRRGNTPLHCAALAISTGGEVIRLLVAFRRSALTVENNMGMLPLHCACLSNSSPVAVQTMVAKSPAGAKLAAGAADSHGNLALHYASSHGASSSGAVVRTLLESDPACSSAQNKQGHLPLDVAKFDENTPSGVVRAIDSAVRLTNLTDDGAAAELHSSMLSQNWSEGANLVLDARPGLVHRLHLDEKVLPAAVRRVERRNSLAMNFELIQGMPHLFGWTSGEEEDTMKVLHNSIRCLEEV